VAIDEYVHEENTYMVEINADILHEIGLTQADVDMLTHLRAVAPEVLAKVQEKERILTQSEQLVGKVALAEKVAKAVKQAIRDSTQDSNIDLFDVPRTLKVEKEHRGKLVVTFNINPPRSNNNGYGVRGGAGHSRAFTVNGEWFQSKRAWYDIHGNAQSGKVPSTQLDDWASKNRYVVKYDSE
jgi:hypothetical protein